MIELEFWNYSSGIEKSRKQMESLQLPHEQQVFTRLTIPRRRDEWLASRWLVKQLIVRVAKLPEGEACSVEILKDYTGKPGVLVAGKPFGSISISHSAGVLLAGFSKNETNIFGCDVEKITSHSAAFLEDYFTRNERFWLADSKDIPFNSSLLWSAKEAVLKALGRGLSIDTRMVECHPWLQQSTHFSGWKQFEVVVMGLPYPLRTVWRQVDDYVLTVCQLAEQAPIDLKLTIRDPGAY